MEPPADEALLLLIISISFSAVVWWTSGFSDRLVVL
jgi:hypothetical protein